MQELTPEHKRRFEDDGFILLDDVLSAREVEGLRAASADYLGEHGICLDSGITQPDAFRHIPRIRWLLAHENVRRIFRYFIGETLEYCHHSDVHWNKYTGWHKDACGRNDFSPDVDGSAYGIYKLALYLQDHASGPPALTVRRRSHLTPQLHRGELVEIHPGVGQVILFDCRLSHKGEDLSIPEKLLREMIPSEKLRTKVFGSLRRLRGEPDKMSIFFTLARPNRFLDEHLDATMRRQLRQSGLESYSLPPDLAAVLTEAGWKYRDLCMTEERRAPA